ncbi:FtsK/SpoIIIE domain-containing protein [Streptomyces roseifaciens]
MQIRLTVLGPLSGHHTTAPAAPTAKCACDVLVTAPAGTALAGVTSGLAAAVAAAGSDLGTGAVVVYAGAERLDPQRSALGEPPLIDGAVLSLCAPADPEEHAGVLLSGVPEAAARLHVVSGPDAGGVHLLHGGEVHVGRSATADIPLDDPDVSRLHCAVVLHDDGTVTLRDLGSTNGTALAGEPVGEEPVRFPAGELLRVGESVLSLHAADDASPRVLPAAPDGEGHLRVGGGLPAAGPATPAGAVAPPVRGAWLGAPAGLAADANPGPEEPVTHGGRGFALRDVSAGGLSVRVPAQPGPSGAPAPGRPARLGGTAERGGTDAYGTRGTAPRPGETGGTARDGGADPYAAGGPAGATGRPSWAGESRRTSYDGGADLYGTDPYGTGSGTGAAGQPGGVTPYGVGDGAGAAGQPGQSGAPGGGLPGQRAYPGRPGGSGLPGQAVPDDSYGQPGRAGQPDGSGHPDGYTAAGHPNRSGEAGRYAPGRPGDPCEAVHDGHAGAATATGQPGEAGKRPRGRGIGAWARRLTGGLGGGRGAGEDEWGDGRDDPGAADRARAEAAALRERWPDPASVLLTALGPGPRLWERGPDHPDLLAVRLGTADRHAPESGALLPSVPVTVGLREAGSLGLAGPRGRLSALARSVLAQLAALHAPASLEFVLISADRARPVEERLAEWSWLGWLPQLRPVRGQDCRLLVAYDREQAAARTAELVRRLDEGPLGPHWPAAAPAAVAAAAARHTGPYTVVIVDGDPGSAELRETVGRLAAGGPAAGIHLVCLADAPATTPASPVPSTLATARTASPAFPHCGAVALLSGDVATVVQVIHRTPAGGGSGAAGEGEAPSGPAVIAAVDAVSRAWAERFARALAPLRMADGALHGAAARVAAALPRSARLLDELGLARATPASLTARWAAATDRGTRPGGRAVAVLGAGPHGPLSVDLAADGPHLLVEGCAGSGKTELLRSLAASLAAADRPDRLSLVLVDGAGAERGEGLRLCTDLPHVSTYLAAADPVRMREFAQALTSELKRRAELLGRLDFTAWHTQHAAASAVQAVTPRRPAEGSGDLDSLPTGTLKLRTQKDGPSLTARTALPRLVVLVDDFDALVAPALGSTGRPAAGSVVRALEAVARDGERLGVHLVAASGRPDRTADTAAVERAGLRATLEIAPPSVDGTPGDGSGAGEPAPGRGRLMRPDDDATTPFQAGRVTGRIPRTATLRPTVVTVDWQRMGDPPTRRPVRELGNGPTDLALLASALQRAAQSAGAEAAPPLL